jgi:FkbM family methyltransferase
MSLLSSAKQGVGGLLRACGLEVRLQRNVEREQKTRARDRLWDEFGCLITLCNARGIGTLLDVGANAGQFAQRVRLAGFGGRIISFEPQSSAHQILTERARTDDKWTVAPRAAVGAGKGTVRINLSENSVSSSVLPMLEKHLSAAPESHYVGSEDVPLIALDDYIDANLSSTSNVLALKMDTQGFEGEVLNGLSRHIGGIAVIFAEMSLMPLYRGSPTFIELFTTICDRGFYCASLVPAFRDPATYEVLAVDGLFARRIES